MDVLLVPVILVWTALPFLVAFVPPTVALSHHRATVAAGALYVGGLGLVVANRIAASARVDRADRTGGQGSATR